MRQVTETLHSKEIQFFDVSDKALKSKYGENKGIWYFGNYFNMDEELIIGMSPTNYHSFVVSGEAEYHPRFSFSKNKLLEARTDVIRAGAFLRIKGLSNQELSSFRSFLSSNFTKKTPSCIEGTFIALENSIGAKLINPPKDKSCLSNYVETLLNEGLVDQNGRVLEVELYTTRNKSLAQMLQEMKDFSRGFRPHFIASKTIYWCLNHLGFKSFTISI